jgi:putative DNA primase/helicase
MTNPIDLLLSRLDRPRKSGKGYTCRCPAHEDRSPSLSVSEGTDGRVLIHCFGGCRADDVIAAVGLGWKDLFPGTLDSDARREYRRQSATQAKKDAEFVLKIRDAAPFLSESDERYFSEIEAQHRQATRSGALDSL